MPDLEALENLTVFSHRKLSRSATSMESPLSLSANKVLNRLCLNQSTYLLCLIYSNHLYSPTTQKLQKTMSLKRARRKEAINQRAKPMTTILSRTRNLYWCSFQDLTIWISSTKRLASGNKMKKQWPLSRKSSNKGSGCCSRLTLSIIDTD